MRTTLRTRAAAAVLGLSAFGVQPALAAIAPFTSGNGELFLAVQDPVGQVSYVLDLGIRMDEFFVTGQRDSGFQLFVPLESANWTTFLAGVADRTRLLWAVMAGDSTGSNNPGQQRLFTTFGFDFTGNFAADRAAMLARLDGQTNGNFTNGLGAAQAGNFFSAINTTGTHPPASDLTVNGDSVNAIVDPGASYFGETGGTGPTLNNGLRGGFVTTNRVGQSSWFYYLTRSGSATGGPLLWDEFDNGVPGPNGTPGPGNDAYWGFVYVEPTNPNPPSWAIYAPDSPYAGKWLLSYTLEPYVAQANASFREFAQSIGRTEYGGGLFVQHLPGAAAASPLESPSFASTVPLGAAGDTGFDIGSVTAVPEPSTWLMWLAALGVLGPLAARRRA